MKAQERFAELWTDYLEGELGEAGGACGVSCPVR